MVFTEILEWHSYTDTLNLLGTRFLLWSIQKTLHILPPLVIWGEQLIYKLLWIGILVSDSIEQRERYKPLSSHTSCSLDLLYLSWKDYSIYRRAIRRAICLLVYSLCACWKVLGSVLQHIIFSKIKVYSGYYLGIFGVCKVLSELLSQIYFKR